jgi:hypothetical protein
MERRITRGKMVGGRKDEARCKRKEERKKGCESKWKE